MQLKLDSRFRKRVEGRFGKYRFEVGVLQDGPHREARRGVRGLKGADVRSSYAGGPIRKKSTKESGLTIAQVSEENRIRLGFNYLTEPFKKRTSDIIKFSNEFFRLAFGRSQKKRAENLLQAIVRNPILRGDYGSNSKITVKIKGFDRKMIDTAQLFKALKARCTVKGGSSV
jgi:hypothetical protein